MDEDNLKIKINEYIERLFVVRKEIKHIQRGCDKMEYLIERESDEVKNYNSIIHNLVMDLMIVTKYQNKE